MFKLTQRLSIQPNYYAIFKSAALEFHTTGGVLAGHSKWANIKHAKALEDGRRSAEFARHARYIRVAVQEGGSPNPKLNTALKMAIDEALKRDMPKATIEGVLKKCAGENAKLEKHVVEIKHGGKVFMVVILYTESMKVTKPLLNTLLKKSGSTYTATTHMFFQKGILEVVGNDKIDAKTSDELEEIATDHAIESGAEELEIIDAGTKHLTFICDPNELQRVKQKLTALGYSVVGAEHVFIPNNPTTLTPAEQETYDKFKNKLKEFGGVDGIYDNVNIED